MQGAVSGEMRSHCFVYIQFACHLSRLRTARKALVWLWLWRGLLPLLSKTRAAEWTGLSCFLTMCRPGLIICRVINLSRWKLAEELTGFFESAVEQDYPDRVRVETPWLSLSAAWLSLLPGCVSLLPGCVCLTLLLSH